MCGIALKHAGHNVRILEQERDERQSHMAGVCLGYDGARFLAQHDQINQSFSFYSNRLQLLNQAGEPSLFVSVPRNVTSWDSLYYRLRAIFDGYKSRYYPTAPMPKLEDGFTFYESQKKVVHIAPSADQKGMNLTVEDGDSGEISKINGDMVIAADGPNSLVRQTYLPACQRAYVGYIAWRGTVQDSDISEETRQVFSKNVTIFMKDRHHCLVYTIPGLLGSLRQAERFLNFLWYTNESPTDLDSIMVDNQSGHRHRTIVPSGQVKEDVWRNQLHKARTVPLPAPYLEVITKIRQPFIQVVTELCAPKAAFEEGKVLLVGDGLTLYRPHTAFSGTQAAFHAMQVADLVEGKIDVKMWEERVLRYGYLHWTQSVWFGEFYQGTLFTAGFAAMRYWIACGAEWIKTWWKGETSLLRTTQMLESIDDS